MSKRELSPDAIERMRKALAASALERASAELYPVVEGAPTFTVAVLREIAEEAGVTTSASSSADRYNAHLVVGAIDRGEPAPSVSRVVRERVVAALAARRAGGAS